MIWSLYISQIRDRKLDEELEVDLDLLLVTEWTLLQLFILRGAAVALESVEDCVGSFIAPLQQRLDILLTLNINRKLGWSFVHGLWSITFEKLHVLHILTKDGWELLQDLAVGNLGVEGHLSDLPAALILVFKPNFDLSDLGDNELIIVDPNLVISFLDDEDMTIVNVREAVAKDGLGDDQFIESLVTLILYWKHSPEKNSGSGWGRRAK